MPRILFVMLLLAAVGVRADDASLGRQDLDQQWQLLTSGKGHGQYGGGQGVRGIFRFVLEGAAVGYDRSRLTAALKIADQDQDRDPSSATFGNLKWDLTAKAVLDRNAVEFCMQQAAVITNLSLNQLDPEGRRILDRIVRFSVEGITRHKVPVTYTNMALMKSENEILVGEYLHDGAFAGRGYADLRAWVSFTSRHGIVEYLSPNYYNPDSCALALVARFAQRADGRADAVKGLTYLWLDAAANWFQPGERLAGAHSRNYDYLYDRGEFDVPLARAGWLSYVPLSEPAGWLDGPRQHLHAFADACGWNPPPERVDPLRQELPRRVVERWGEPAAAIATDYVGRHFALASAGASHSDDDHDLLVYWPGDRHTVQSDFFFDGRGDPYGNRPRMGKDGHAKALHLTPLLATAQRGPEVLQLLTDEPYAKGGRNHPGDLSELNAQWTLPSTATLIQNQTVLRPGARVDLRRPFFVRVQDVVLGVKILLATDVHGAPVREANYVQEDPASDRKHLTIVLSPTEPFGRGTVVVWMRAKEGITSSEAFAAFAAAFTEAPGSARHVGNRFEARASGLEISADPTKSHSAKSKGGDPLPTLLSVNGEEIGAPIFLSPSS